MSEQVHLDHIGLVVGNIERVVAAWSLPRAHPIEEFPAEGTRELYVGDSARCHRLLLMQPIGAGPYQDAYAKRGPGLHHLAYVVGDVSKFRDLAIGTGWQQPVKSLPLFESFNQLWLYRPGIPALIEINENKAGSKPEHPVVEQIHLPVADRSPFEIFESDALVFGDSQTSLVLGGRRLALENLQVLHRFKIVPFAMAHHRPLIPQLTHLLHAAYKPLLDRGMRYNATHQDDAVTEKRLTSGHGFLGFLDGELVATITLNQQGPDEQCTWYQKPEVCFFQQFAVHPNLQNHGFGRVLLEHVENTARQLGAQELALDTAEHAHGLIAFYETLGYRIVERADWSSTNYVSVVMSKSLIDNSLGKS